MTQATQNIWIVVFKEDNGNNRTQKLAAYNLQEVLSYFNESGISKIVKIEKTDEMITYRY